MIASANTVAAKKNRDKRALKVGIKTDISEGNEQQQCRSVSEQYRQEGPKTENLTEGRVKFSNQLQHMNQKKSQSQMKDEEELYQLM